MTPSCNRKSMAGNPPPTVRAPVLDPTVKITRTCAELFEVGGDAFQIPTPCAWVIAPGRRLCTGTHLYCCESEPMDLPYSHHLVHSGPGPVVIRCIWRGQANSWTMTGEK